jgi:hypothetical protein
MTLSAGGATLADRQVPRLCYSTTCRIFVFQPFRAGLTFGPRRLRQAQGRLYGPVSVLRFVFAFSHTLFNPRGTLFALGLRFFSSAA